MERDLYPSEPQMVGGTSTTFNDLPPCARYLTSLNPLVLSTESVFGTPLLKGWLPGRREDDWVTDPNSWSGETADMWTAHFSLHCHCRQSEGYRMRGGRRFLSLLHLRKCARVAYLLNLLPQQSVCPHAYRHIAHSKETL